MDRVPDEKGFWKLQALCNTDEWRGLFSPPFPRKQGGKGERVVQETKYERERRESKAKAICNSCPVIDDCLDAMLDMLLHSRGECPEVWAGMTVEDRRALKKERFEESHWGSDGI